MKTIYLPVAVFLTVVLNCSWADEQHLLPPDAVEEVVKLVDGRVPGSRAKSIRFSKIIFYYKDNAKIGERAWDENGDLVNERQYKDGKLHGFSRQYWPNGKLAGENTFVNGVRQGGETRWHSNGKIAETLNHRNDRAHGILRCWDAEGKRVQYTGEAFYNGRRLGVYNVDGSAVSREEYVKATESDKTLPIPQNDD